MDVKSVDNADIVELLNFHELKGINIRRNFTRHYVNLSLILPHTELSLFMWLSCMADEKNTFLWSTKLFYQFEKASELASEYYKVDKIGYSTTTKPVRIAFISLINKGILIKMKEKKRYMVNPMLVYPTAINGNKLGGLYSAAGKEGLKKLCDKIYRNEI